MVDGHFQQLVGEGPDGRMWSEQLQSWLVPAGQKLKLYDRDGNLRLTEVEYTKQQLQQQKLEAEQQRLETEQQRQEAEQQKLKAEQQRQEAEQQKLKAEKFAQKLRELGIDPDTLE